MRTHKIGVCAFVPFQPLANNTPVSAGVEWPLLILPTDGGQSDQAVVDSSKASGAT